MASGGIYSYLTNYGNRLDETLLVTKSNEMPVTIELLELIKTKYFKNKMPKKLDGIQDLIYENYWWFEDEYDKYYYKIEKELC